jgi:hypothetical protein
MMDMIATLNAELNNRIASVERRPGILQIIAPYYHSDGDMHEVYLVRDTDTGEWRLSDLGQTLMRLSYTFDMLSDGRDALVQNIVAENGLAVSGAGMIEAPVNSGSVFYRFMGMERAISQIMSIQYQQSNRQSSRFIEDVYATIRECLPELHIERDYVPVKSREDLTVDIKIAAEARPFFVYAAKSDSQYLRAGISCSELSKLKVKFRSVVIIEDNGKISPQNWKTVTNIVSKQCIGTASLHGEFLDYIRDESAA